MLSDIKEYCREINDLIQELDNYESYKEQLKQDLYLLEQRYQKGKYTYEKYLDLKKKLLLGKTKEGLLSHYNANILSLLKKIDFLNTEIFSEVYEDKSLSSLNYASQFLSRQTREAKKASEVYETQSSKSFQENSTQQNYAKQPVYSKQELKELSIEQKQKIIQAPVEIKGREKNQLEILTPKAQEVRITSPVEARIQELSGIEIPKPLPLKSLSIPKPSESIYKKIKLMFQTKPKKKSLFDEIEQKEKIELKGGEGIRLGSVFNLGIIKNIKDRARQKSDFLSKETAISSSLLRFTKKEVESEKINAEFSETLLEKQAKQIRTILSGKKVTIYNPTSLGYFANLSVRRISLFFMDQFPDFFKNLYLNLRYANIKLLSNTYVNIMFFMSILGFFLFVPISFVFFVIQSPLFLIALAKSFVLGLIFSGLIFAGFYLYPQMRIKNRIRSINTNLPFAIDHMSSVTASGVPPATMFKLIADSKEYGEVSFEIEKISNYIDLFGYDLITAIRTVAITTPSPQFKEFFEGMINTIEAGGDLKNYLSEKSKEALLSYRLERQKYVEAIATYSDMYIGILIAAPLFFISTLALVSMLGGSVGGMAVDTLIALGTYLVIPVLNILFIVFLELNQPQV
jgi:archaeal flagellar protein FlaJ